MTQEKIKDAVAQYEKLVKEALNNAKDPAKHATVIPLCLRALSIKQILESINTPTNHE